MPMKKSSILKMYAVTPCHAGCGFSQGVVDLPIQRERHTGWPVVQSSGVKGAMRAHFEEFKESIPESDRTDQFETITDLVFGSEKSEYAGSLSVSDAKILAFPMRSNTAPFVWITSPAVLKRLNRDLRLAGKSAVEDLSFLDTLIREKAWCLSGDITGRVLLEDLEVVAEDGGQIREKLGPLMEFFTDGERLLLVHDESFGYGVTSCTSVMAQIKIDQATGTTQNGSLRYQEELPADTIMYSVVFWGASRDGARSLQAETIAGYIREQVMNSHLQIGGDETLGRGIFELAWM